MKRKDKNGNIDETMLESIMPCRRNFQLNVTVSAANEQRRMTYEGRRI